MGVVLDPYMILTRYATTWSMLPLNLVAFAALPLSLASSYASPWMRLPVLARLIQLPNIADEFFVQLARGRKSDNYSARKLRNLLCLALFMLHATASLYGLAFGAGYPEASPLPPFKLTYTYGIWWAAGALSALGSLPTPQPIGQLAFTTCVLVGALFTTVYLIAHLGVLISNLDASALTFRKKRNATELFVRRQGLPEQLAARVSRYQQLAWVRGAGHNLRTVVADMNSTIRADIMHHICHAVVIAVIIDAGVETSGCLAASLLAMLHTPLT